MSQKFQDQPHTPQSAHPHPESAHESQPPRPAPVQGEGDYEAARRYRDEVSEFLSRADVDEIAHSAAPKSALEARELAIAAERGRERSKGDDPADVGAMYPGHEDGKP